MPLARWQTSPAEISKPPFCLVNRLIETENQFRYQLAFPVKLKILFKMRIESVMESLTESLESRSR